MHQPPVWPRRLLAVVAALALVAVGGMAAVVCLWFAAWDWQGTTTGPATRRNLYWAAVIVSGVSVVGATALLLVGFRRPKPGRQTYV